MTEYAELRAALAAGPTPGPWAWGADSRIATVARVSDYRIGPDHGTSYEAHYEFHAPDHVDAAYAAGETLRAMTPDERQWCIDEADRAGEGFYKSAELSAMDDQELAGAVLNAWHMYVQSNYL